MKRNGFTLVELLVVVAILGIIAAVAIPNVLSFMNSGRVEAANTEVHNVTVAQTAYMVEHDGIAAASTDGLTAYIIGGLEARYTFDANGNITGAVLVADSKWDGLTFDATTDKWSK